MKKFLLSAAMVGLLACPAAAQQLTGWNLPKTTGTTRGIMPGVQTTTSNSISNNTNSTTRIIQALNAKATTWITGFLIDSAGATTVQLVYGTQTTTPCDTGQNPLTGVMTLASGTPLHFGTGLGPVLVPPPGQDVCLINSAAVQVSGAISFAQF